MACSVATVLANGRAFQACSFFGLEVVIAQLLCQISQNSFATFIILQSPDLTKWAIGVSNNGELGASIVTTGTVVTLIVASPDTTKWAITVSNAGEFSVATTASATTAKTMNSPNNTVFTVTVSDAGELGTA